MDPTLSETRPAEAGYGWFNERHGLSEASVRYLEARGSLFSVEAREALLQGLTALVFGLTSAIAILTGWFLLMAALVYLLADWADWSWGRSAGVLALVNLLVAGALLFLMIKRVKSARWFGDTLEELKKDRAWLKRKTTRG